LLFAPERSVNRDPSNRRPMNTRKLYRLALLAAIAFLPGCLVFTCGG
jgi:hypothetical protein